MYIYSRYVLFPKLEQVLLSNQCWIARINICYKSKEASIIIQAGMRHILCQHEILEWWSQLVAVEIVPYFLLNWIFTYKYTNTLTLSILTQYHSGIVKNYYSIYNNSDRSKRARAICNLKVLHIRS